MSEVRRVAHLVLSLHTGGLERCVLEWTMERERRLPGSTIIVCLDEPGELAARYPGTRILLAKGTRSGIRGRNQLVASLREIYREERTSIIHTHNLAALIHGAQSRIAGMGHVHTHHGENPHDAGWRAERAGRNAVRSNPSLVAVSEGVAGICASRWRIEPDRIRVISNGVRAPRDVTASRDEFGLPDMGALIGCVGRLEAIKGQDRLLRAFEGMCRAIEKDSDRPHLVLIGDGSERTALQESAKAMGLSENVHFMGDSGKVAELLSLCDLYVQPSRSEGLPMALLEAMSAGLPSFVTGVGDMPHVVANEAGVVLEEDEQDWGKQIADLLADEASRSVIGSTARQRVEALYSLSTSVEAYEKVYQLEKAHS